MIIIVPAYFPTSVDLVECDARLELSRSSLVASLLLPCATSIVIFATFAVINRCRGAALAVHVGRNASKNIEKIKKRAELHKHTKNLARLHVGPTGFKIIPFSGSVVQCFLDGFVVFFVVWIFENSS